MNACALQHIPESIYCFAISKNQVKIRLRVSKNDDIEKVNILYGCKYDFQNKRYIQEMKKTYETDLFIFYETLLNLKDVRLVYIFEIYEGGDKWFYSEDGISLKYDFQNSFYNCFQYSYINENDLFKCVSWVDNAVFYQIFIDRFNIGDSTKNKSYINLKWGELPTPKSFAGGDIKGVENKLEYLKELGFNALYLTPLFESISNHKYDTKDYFKIDKNFGTEDDLKSLVEKAHKLGIKVVLDAVFNHCSNQMKEFQDVIKNGKNSKYYNWFIYNEEKDSFETFATCDYMPKLNTANEEVQEFLISVAMYYIKNIDIDGWRLDVSDEVSHQFWKRLRRVIKKEKPDCIIIGENWHNAQSFLRGDEFDSIMNYAFTKACLDYFAYDRFNSKEMANKLNELIIRNNDYTNRMMLNLLDSHDTLRFLTEVKENKDKLYQALSLLFMYVGIPCIYYGTEIDMLGGYDPDSRRTYDWNYPKIETKNLLHCLSKLRRDGKLKGSDIKIYSNDDLLIVERYQEDLKLTLYINNTTKKIKICCDNAILSNKFSKKIIEPQGFVLTEKRRVKHES